MKTIKIIIYVFIALAIAGFVYYKFFYNAKPKVQETSSINKLIGKFEGIVAKASDLTNEIEVTGSIVPLEETSLTTEVSGKVVKINLQEGKPVKKGSVLVKLFDDDLQAQLKMLEVQLKIAKNNEQRMRALLNVQGTSQQDYDASLLQVNNLNAQIDILKVNIGKTEIKAPYDGVIGLKKVSLGQYLTPATLIASIRAVDKLKLDFSVPETYGSMMKQGLKVNFTVGGLNNKYSASVIANEFNIDQDSRNLSVRAIVDGNIAGLTPGAFAKVKVNLGEKKDAILIPTSAIIPQSSKKKVCVVKDGLAQMVNVETGIRRESDIEVTSGISVGDTIVTTGLLFIKPNNQIKLTKVK